MTNNTEQSDSQRESSYKLTRYEQETIIHYNQKNARQRKGGK
jgi:hypothetical protein